MARPNARHFAVGFVFALALAVAPGARAQDGSSAREVETARREFRAGVAAARAGRWEQAEAAFERAYSLSSQPVVLFNLAAARAQLGRLRQARDTYRTFLAEGTSANAATRQEAETALAEVTARLGRLEIEVTNALPQDRVTIDGEAIEDWRSPVEVDPGEHRILAFRDGEEIAAANVRVAERQSLPVVLEAPVARDAASLTAPAVGVEPSESELPAPAPVGSDDGWIWFGVITGVVVLAAIATIVAVVLVEQSAGPAPYMGSVDGGSLSVSGGPFVGNVSPGILRF